MGNKFKIGDIVQCIKHDSGGWIRRSEIGVGDRVKFIGYAVTDGYIEHNGEYTVSGIHYTVGSGTLIGLKEYGNYRFDINLFELVERPSITYSDFFHETDAKKLENAGVHIMQRPNCYDAYQKYGLGWWEDQNSNLKKPNCHDSEADQIVRDFDWSKLLGNPLDKKPPLSCNLTPEQSHGDYWFGLDWSAQPGYTTTSNIKTGTIYINTFFNKLKQKTMNVLEIAKNMTLSKNEKELRKAGLKDSCGNFTTEAKQIVIDKLCQDNEEYLLTIAAASEKESNTK